MTTLAVVRAWGDDPEAGVRLLREAIERARELGPGRGVVAGRRQHGGRPRAARASRRGDRRGVPRTWPRRARWTSTRSTRTCSAATSPGILVDVGRWSEARELSLRALDWSPAGVPFVNAILNLVIVEIESEAGEEAGRLLGRVLVELETGGDFQFAVPAYQATASYAMWSGDLADARRAAERGWARVRGTEDWVLMARMAATALEVEAAIVAEALEKRRIGDVAASRERAGRILAEADAAVARARADDDGTRPRASPRRASRPRAPSTPGCRAATTRPPGPTWPGAGTTSATRTARRARAGTRPRRSSAAPRRASSGSRTRTDARVVRADAREPLAAAVELAMRLRARPLLRELRQLAGRALIQLPPEVDAMLAEPAPTPPGPRPAVSPGPVADATAPRQRRRRHGPTAAATRSGCPSASSRCSR